jgi:hypothetical protein
VIVRYFPWWVVTLVAPLSIRLAMCFSLHKVWQTVREERPNSPCGADGLWVEDGWSVIEGIVLEVRGYFWMVRAAPRTVRLGHADGPLGACGRSTWCSAELLCPLLFEF